MSAKSAGEALGAVIHALLIQMRIGYEMLADLVKVTVDWAKSSDMARSYLQLVAVPVQALFALLKDGPAYFAGFSAAAKVRSGDFSWDKAEFTNLGTSIGDAYNKAFAAAATKKVAASATVASAGDDEPKRAQGGDGMTDTAREKVRKEAKAAQDKADHEHLNCLKQ